MSSPIVVPSEYRKRKRLWVDASVWLAVNERSTISSSIQNLGYAERVLLELEGDVSRLAKDPSAKKRRDTLLMECTAHSEFWMLGLYEILRTLKEAGTPRFEPLRPLFRKIELLRMQIAKHELKRVKGQDVVAHYTTHFWNPETGHVGWSVFEPDTRANFTLFRTPTADEFLALAAVEPEFRPPFPIGGPLGMDED